MVVSDTQAKVHVKELGDYLWVPLVEGRFAVNAMILVLLTRGRKEKLPAVTKQKAVPSIEVSSAKRKL